MNKEKSAIFSKWLIKGIDGFCFGSDKELYRLPFKSGRNHFGLRKLKKQPKDRWKIGGVWWSERQLKAKIYLNPSPELLIENKEHPF